MARARKSCLNDVLVKRPLDTFSHEDTHSKKRKRGREWQTCESSRFIAELAQEDLRVSGRESSAESQKQEGTARLAQLKAMLKK